MFIANIVKSWNHCHIADPGSMRFIHGSKVKRFDNMVLNYHDHKFLL